MSTGLSLLAKVQSKRAVWLVFSGVIYACCQLGVLLTITNVGTLQNANVLGDYILSLSIVSPVFMFSNFNIRLLISSEQDESKVYEYFYIRQYSILVSVLAILGISYFVLLRQPVADYEVFVLVVAISLLKAAESLDDFTYGLMQRASQFRKIFGSIVFRGFSYLVLVFVILKLGFELQWAIGLVAIAWWSSAIFNLKAFSCEVVSDKKPKYGSIVRLLVTCVPLGFSNLSLSLIQNLPRYYIEINIGREALGIFGAIQQVTKSGLIVVTALINSWAKYAADLYKSKKYKEFVIIEIIAYTIVVMMCGFIIVLAELYSGHLFNLIGVEGTEENIFLLRTMVFVSMLGFLSIINNKILIIQRKTVHISIISIIICSFIYMQLFWDSRDEAGWVYHVTDILLEARWIQFGITLIMVLSFVFVNSKKEK